MRYHELENCMLDNCSTKLYSHHESLQAMPFERGPSAVFRCCILNAGLFSTRPVSIYGCRLSGFGFFV